MYLQQRSKSQTPCFTINLPVEATYNPAIQQNIHCLFTTAFYSAGVYVGCMYADYQDVILAVAAKLPPHAVVGSGASFMVGRLSYSFGFTGGAQQLSRDVLIGPF